MELDSTNENKEIFKKNRNNFGTGLDMKLRP